MEASGSMGKTGEEKSMKLLKTNLVFAFLFSYVRDARFCNIVLGSENNHQKRRSYPNSPSRQVLPK
jgi:hypothetical protein